jgi:hypothetical protein
MLRCWHTNPKCRPTFKNCLEVLLELKVSVEEDPAPIIMSDIYGKLYYFNFVGLCLHGVLAK